MSENDNSWEEMLRAVMGDEAAERVIEQMKASGIDPSASMEQLSGMDFTAVMSQVRAMLGSSGDGPVNWKVGEQVARDTIQRDHFDTVTSSEGSQAREALSVASLWLDPATAIDPCTGPNQAWSRLDWLAHSLPTFKRLTEPVADNVARAFLDAVSGQLDSLPEEMRDMMGGIEPEPMMRSLMASLTAVQYGQGLAQLATVSFGTSDAGLPLVEGHTAALVPANIEDFAEGLDVPLEEVRLYVALREQAAARLFTRIPWLRARVLDSVAAYAREIAIDTDAIEEQVRASGFDPEKMQNFDLGAVFAPEPSEGQLQALAGLQHLLSLIEGWVSAVSLQVAAAQLPHAIALGEMFNRRASTSSPAQRVFGPLVGLSIEPRKNREAQRFWELAYAKLGVEDRDALWQHPDLLPTPSDLEAPESFFDAEKPSSAVEDELDAFLAELLDTADGEGQQAPPQEQAGAAAKGTDEDPDDPTPEDGPLAV